MLTISLMFLLLASSPTASPPEGIDAEVQALLMRLADGGRVGPDSSFSVSQPARRVYELGAVIGGDPRAPAVLAITPSGAAAGMGLRAGDLLLDVNGEALARHPDPASAIQRALADRNGELALKVVRGGRTLSLSGRAAPVSLPAYQLTVGAAPAAGIRAPAACGRVSSFDSLPRARQLFPVKVIAIDGKAPGPANSDVFRVVAGRHELILAELIDSREFSAVANAQRARRGDRYKTLVVDIAPDQTVQLAARLVQAARGSIVSGEYWEPAIHRQVPEPCR